MKKLSAILTLFILVACQPSELERCVEANIGESDYLNKWNAYLDKLELLEAKHEKIFDAYNNDPIKNASKINDILPEFDSILYPFEESLTVLEEKMYGSHPTELFLLSAREQKEASQQQILQEHISKVLLDDKDIATDLCNSQGIY